MRIVSESGHAWPEPTEDLIFEALAEVAGGREEFLILEDTQDAYGETYVQAVTDGDGGFLVERRDGSADHHFRTTCPSIDAAHRVVVGWAFPPDPEADTVAWQRVGV